MARKFEISMQQCDIQSKIDNLNYGIIRRIWKYVYRFDILPLVWHIKMTMYSQCLLGEFSMMDEWMGELIQNPKDRH